MTDLLRLLFFAFIVRPAVLITLGLNIRHRERLPKQGPALIVANHNSHLDTMVLMTLFPLSLLPKVHPVGAADYFFKDKWISWFSSKIIGIIPIERQSRDRHADPLALINQSLANGDIVIFFPEGSRGDPERMVPFKSGVAHLVRQHPELPVIPIFLHGLGKSLPKGEGIFVPFFCDVFVGEPITWTGDKSSMMETLTSRMSNLADEGQFPAWD